MGTETARPSGSLREARPFGLKASLRDRSARRLASLRDKRLLRKLPFGPKVCFTFHFLVPYFLFVLLKAPLTSNILNPCSIFCNHLPLQPFFEPACAFRAHDGFSIKRRRQREFDARFGVGVHLGNAFNAHNHLSIDAEEALGIQHAR